MSKPPTPPRPLSKTNLRRPIKGKPRSYSQRLVASSVAAAGPVRVRRGDPKPAADRNHASPPGDARPSRDAARAADDMRRPRVADRNQRDPEAFRKPDSRPGSASRGKPSDRTPARTDPPVVRTRPPKASSSQRTPPPAKARVDVQPSGPSEPMRIAKAMARAGLCSRRDAERWIADGRVAVNGRLIPSPALDVGPADRIVVDGQPLPAAAPAQLWRYHKPRGLVTTHADPEGRATVFDALPPDMPRVVSIGRLDYNTEGLLLLTNDGALARHLELPATGWVRRYRVRAHGRVSQSDLDTLKGGTTIDGVRYAGIEATIDSVQSGNMWMSIALKEGKNREVRRILSSLMLDVNRLIRVSYGPFQLMDLPTGAVEPVRRRVLADQLGPLAESFGLTGPIDGYKARHPGAKPAAKPE